jgi:hypothetical protein
MSLAIMKLRDWRIIHPIRHARKIKNPYESSSAIIFDNFEPVIIGMADSIVVFNKWGGWNI